MSFQGFNISNASDIRIENTSISELYIGNTLIWSAQHDYSLDYFTIESLEDENDIKWQGASNQSKTISYSTNLIDWTDFTSAPSANTFISLNAGDKVYIKGTNEFYNNSNATQKNTFLATKTFNVSGNIMSLFWGDNFIGKTLFPNYTPTKYTCGQLFKNSTNLVNAGNLILPATTLVDSVGTGNDLYAGCYSELFYGCTSLVTIPKLPATTLGIGCYNSMFQNCTSLNTVPELPVTTLIYACYRNIFKGCTSLNTVPVLPATTLVDYCYNGMFYGCTSLTTAPELPATTLAPYCYYNMFQGCTSLTTAPELPATTLTNYCYAYMFYKCTGLTTAPELPATTLAQSCYNQMFNGCTSLTTAPELPATTLVDNCYRNMFNGCESLNYIKCLALTIATDATTNWTTSVAATGTFVKDATMTDWTTGVDGIPSGWTVQDAV